MEQNSNSGHRVVVQSTLLTLPIEVLVYICSFLSIRDIVKVRCVSKIFRHITETPSLWKTFFWSLYPPHNSKLLEHVLKMFGEHIKKFHFADVAPSKLEVMLKYCKHVTHLSLPRFTYYSKIGKLENIVRSMASLQILDIQSSTTVNVQQVFKLANKLKELTIYCRSDLSLDDEMPKMIEHWANSNYVPRKLNLVFTHFEKLYHTLDCLKHNCLPVFKNRKLSKCLDLPNTACFSICFKKSTDFVSVVPYIQVFFTDSTLTFPAVRGGPLGLDMVLFKRNPPEIARVLHLTQGYYHGKKVHKALMIQGIDDIDEYIDNNGTSLTSVTYVDASSCLRNPSHLIYLSDAFPNLQRLDFSGNGRCLRDLEGLRSLAKNCRNLRCLNLKGINKKDFTPPEGHVTVRYDETYNYDRQALWEILLTMQLTELSVEGWMFSSLSTYMFQEQEYPSLQALEVTSLTDEKFSLFPLCYFPSITFCKINRIGISDFYWLWDIFSCRFLRYLLLHFTCVVDNYTLDRLSLPSKGHYSCLQEVYLDAQDTVLAETFINTLCGHGGLEHVVLHVNSLTAKSITNLIEHSPNLMTFDITLSPLSSWTEAQLKHVIARVRTKFFKTRLIDGGLFSIKLCSMSNLNSRLKFNEKDHWTFC